MGFGLHHAPKQSRETIGLFPRLTKPETSRNNERSGGCMHLADFSRFASALRVRSLVSTQTSCRIPGPMRLHQSGRRRILLEGFAASLAAVLSLGAAQAFAQSAGTASGSSVFDLLVGTYTGSGKSEGIYVY